jgi:hypothetical protein
MKRFEVVAGLMDGGLYAERGSEKHPNMAAKSHWPTNHVALRLKDLLDGSNPIRMLGMSATQELLLWCGVALAAVAIVGVNWFRFKDAKGLYRKRNR